jgi:hypothetical protein
MISRVEQPSLLESLVELPGALVRLPSSAVTALDAINDLSARLDRLMVMMERIEGSLPPLSDSASALRNLTERLGTVAVELATELPKATRSLQEVSPELSAMVGLLDERFAHLDSVLTDVARLMEGVVGMIPGMRRVLRPSTPA